MKHKKFDFRTAYIDLLLNVLTAIIFLFMLSTLLIQVKVKKDNEGVKRDAQYVINATWDTSLDCDVDIWVRDPNGNVVNFQKKDSGLMHIERDDLGLLNDVVTEITQKILGQNPQNNLNNQETWVLRGITPGEYTVNLHLYSCRINGKALGLGELFPVKVDVELIRLNPRYLLTNKESVTLEKIWQQKTVLSFTLNANGDVIDTNKNFVPLVKAKQQ